MIESSRLRSPISSPLVQQILVGAASAGIAGSLILMNGESGLLVLSLICLTALAGYVSYTFPTLTVALWGISTLYIRELGFIMPTRLGLTEESSAAYSDPVLLGIAAALSVAAFSGDERVRQALRGPCLILSFLIAWAAFTVLRSIPEFGTVSATREFLRFFQPLLIIPYIIVFFRSEAQQRRLLKMLIVLSLTFIAMAVIKGGFTAGFDVSRWIGSYASLALVWGAIALYVARKWEFVNPSLPAYVALMFAAISITIILNHRSVWMASAAAVAFLVLFRQIPATTVTKLIFGLLVCGLTIDFLYREMDVIEFLQNRMLAFTSYEEDGTARSRARAWAGALEASKNHLMLGSGFGNRFEIYLEDGHLHFRNPHNFYFTVLYKIGLVGLFLYLGFVLQTARNLRVAMRHKMDAHTTMLSMLGLVILIGAICYNMAYVLDTFTWLFVGLGLSAMLTASEARGSDRPSEG